MSANRGFAWRIGLTSLVVLFLLVLAAQAGRLLHMRINGVTKAQPVRKRQIPYTVTLREIIHAPDGTTRETGDIIFAARSDGSTVFRGAGGKGRNLYFSSGLTVDINDVEHTKTSTNVPSQISSGLNRDPNSKCLNGLDGKPMTSPPETLIGEETISGYRTVKIASDIVTTWHALDYGCALVKDRWDFSATEMSEKELVALSAGEPASDLFDVPSSYREVPPSERIMGSKKQCRPCNEETFKHLQMLDEAYERSKRRRP